MIPEMTLQDWFAGQVIAAMIGSDPAYSSTRDNDGRLCGIEQSRLLNMATNAYQAAEAMMKARATAPQADVARSPERKPSVKGASPDGANVSAVSGNGRPIAAPGSTRRT